MEEEKATSQATKRRNLIRKFKGLWREYKDVANYKEPALILMRRHGNDEIFEDATKGEFVYKHTDGEERTITLKPTFLRNLPYGKKTIKYYLCHEDFPLPLPEDPVITAETVGIGIDKTLNDVKKWKTKEMSEKTKMFWTIATGIALVIGAVTFYKMLVPAKPEIIVQTAKTTAEIIKANTTGGVTLIP